VLKAAFARAFDCVDPDRKENDAKLNALARRWLDFIQTLPVEAAEIHAKIREFHAKMARPAAPAGGGRLGNPGLPGGGPGLPGGIR
jgi:hypothetical protein